MYAYIYIYRQFICILCTYYTYTIITDTYVCMITIYICVCVYIYIYIYRVKTQGSPKTERASSNVKDGKFIFSCVSQYILPSFNVILHHISHHVVRTKMDVVRATCTCFCTFFGVKLICWMLLPVELRRHVFSASRTILKMGIFTHGEHMFSRCLPKRRFERF